MKQVSLVVALALVSLPPSVAAADPLPGAVIVGSGAIASFEQVSDDGCVTTFGEIALLRTRIGTNELADGLYVTGMQENTCTGAGNGFAGYAEGSGGVLWLIGARFTGTVVAPSYSGGDAVTLELDLRWIGRGPVIREGGWFHDDTQVSFQFSRRRDAATTGTFTVDGDPATVTSATLIFEAHGELTL